MLRLVSNFKSYISNFIMSTDHIKFFSLPLNKYGIDMLVYIIFMDKLKTLFKVSSTYQLVVVFIVFGITGSMSLVVSEHILNFFDLNNILLSVLFILIVYQVLLIIIGSIFGEFRYFWEMEKKIISRFKFKK